MAMDIGNMNAASLGLTKTVVAETGVTVSNLKDGSYKVDGTDVLDAKGQKVGKVNGNKIELADGTAAAIFADVTSLTAGSIINVKNGEAELRTPAHADVQKLASGEYEISGTNVLKDGVKVGEYDAAGKAAKITVDGVEVSIDKAKLGLANELDATNNKFTVGGIDVSTREQATGSITAVDSAIQKVSEQRSALGAVQNRLEHTINNLGAASENLTAAESRIRDTDMAKEMMEFTKNNILMQAAQSMLAQANQQPQGVLQLLG